MDLIQAESVAVWQEDLHLADHWSKAIRLRSTLWSTNSRPPKSQTPLLGSVCLEQEKAATVKIRSLLQVLRFQRFTAGCTWGYKWLTQHNSLHFMPHVGDKRPKEDNQNVVTVFSAYHEVWDFPQRSLIGHSCSFRPHEKWLGQNMCLYRKTSGRFLEDCPENTTQTNNLSLLRQKDKPAREVCCKVVVSVLGFHCEQMKVRVPDADGDDDSQVVPESISVEHCFTEHLLSFVRFLLCFALKQRTTGK